MQKLTFSVSEKQFVAGSGEEERGFKATVLVHTCFFAFMCAPPAVALSPFDAQLRDCKMWAIALSHFLRDVVWLCVVVLYIWLCMLKYICVCVCIRTVTLHLLCGSWYMLVSGGIWAYWTLLLVDAYVCVWVHSYVCIFKMVVFLHVTHSTFYTCGVICNACSVHKCDYVTV